MGTNGIWGVQTDTPVALCMCSSSSARRRRPTQLNGSNGSSSWQTDVQQQERQQTFPYSASRRLLGAGGVGGLDNAELSSLVFSSVAGVVAAKDQVNPASPYQVLETYKQTDLADTQGSFAWGAQLTSDFRGLGLRVCGLGFRGSAQERFARAMFRSTRGNAFTHFKRLEEEELSVYVNAEPYLNPKLSYLQALGLRI